MRPARRRRGSVRGGRQGRCRRRVARIPRRRDARGGRSSRGGSAPSRRRMPRRVAARWGGHAEQIGALLVEEARVEVADLARLGALLGLLRLLDDLSHGLLGLLVELDERAVARLVGRDLGAGDPLAVDVPEEVVLRAHCGIELVEADARGGGRRRSSPPDYAWRAPPRVRLDGTRHEDAAEHHLARTVGLLAVARLRARGRHHVHPHRDDPVGHRVVPHRGGMRSGRSGARSCRSRHRVRGRSSATSCG